MGTVDLTKKTVNLSKGQKVNLSKAAKGLDNITIGLGWDSRSKMNAGKKKKGLFGKISEAVVSSNEGDIDCDVWLIMKSGDKVENTIYYGNKTLSDNNGTFIQHMGDNITGDGDGDDEQIKVRLSGIPTYCDNIVVGVTIYLANRRGQSFDLLQNTFIRIVDDKDNFELCRYNQEEIGEVGATSFIAAKIIRVNGEWEVEALGKATKDGTIEKAVRNFRG